MIYSYKCNFCGKEEDRNVPVAYRDDQYCDCLVGEYCVHKDQNGNTIEVEHTPDNARHPTMERKPTFDKINLQPASDVQRLEDVKQKGIEEGWIIEQ